MNNNNNVFPPYPPVPPPAEFQFVPMDRVRTLLDLQYGLVGVVIEKEGSSELPHAITLDTKGLVHMIWGLRLALMELERQYIPPTPQY